MFLLMDASNLECTYLPQKSHLSETDCDLEDVVSFSKPRLDLSWDVDGISK